VSWRDVLYVRGLALDSLKDVTARHVLLVIATHSNRSGRAWPSMTTLAAETGTSRSTVRRAFPKIEAAAVVQVIHRPGGTCQVRFPHLCHPDAYLCHLRPDLCHRWTTKQPEPSIETHAGARASEIKAAINECPYCDRHGWLEWPDGSVGRCSHQVRWPETTTVDDVLNWRNT
jgi:hypothetical protein